MNTDGLKTNAATRSPGFVLIRCGGQPPRARWSLKAAGCPARIAVPLVELADLHEAVRRQGWHLALVLPEGMAETTIDAEDKLTVPAQSAYDPLCPSCTAAVLDRLRAQGPR